jgi:hypothetical protein
LVSQLRAQGSTTEWPISLVLGDYTLSFTFSGTCMHEHIVLTASAEGVNLDLIVPASKNQKNTSGTSDSPEKLASADLMLIEEVNRINSTILLSNYKPN